jgi:hypothetical protein
MPEHPILALAHLLNLALALTGTALDFDGLVIADEGAHRCEY